MADAYVNFYGDLDAAGFERGAQAFQGVASQAHRAAAAVGAAAASATSITMSTSGNETVYAEIKATSGDVFACILPAGSSTSAITDARIRIDEGEKVTLARNRLASNPTLYLWAV